MKIYESFELTPIADGAAIPFAHGLGDLIADRDVTFIGHSLGGALATLAGVDAALLPPRHGDRIRIVTFASPRVGNSEFARLAQAVGRIDRVCNLVDLVPAVPSSTVEALGIGLAKRGIMKGRLAFPIRDVDGNLIAYAGRYPADEMPDGVEKWLLPRGFHKHLALCNIDRVKTGVHTVMLVESCLSVLKHHSILGGSVVACFGHSLSDAQVALLQAQGVNRVCICFDGDDAGRTGAEAVAGKLAMAGIWARTAPFADGVKPHHLTYVQLVAAMNGTSEEDARQRIRAGNEAVEKRRRSHWWPFGGKRAA